MNGRKPSKRTRRARAQVVRLSEVRLSRATRELIGTCAECGQRGPHLVPASHGIPAVWTCTGRFVESDGVPHGPPELWEAEVGALLRRASRAAGRPLTMAERAGDVPDGHRDRGCAPLEGPLEGWEAGLRQIGQDMLPPDFEASLRSYGELMADVQAVTARDGHTEEDAA